MYAAGKSLAEIFASEWNAWERQRSSLIARLHGYTDYEPGDTFESLKAAYEAHIGGAYESREEEAARIREAGKAARDAKYKAARDAEWKIIEDAKANDGFMDCVEITKSWGYSGLRWAIALKRTEMAGEPIVVLIPDGQSVGVGKIPVSQAQGLVP